MTMRRLRHVLLITTAIALGAAGETGSSSIEGRMSGAFGAFLVGRQAAQHSDFATAARELEQAQRDDPTVPELNNQAFISALLAGQPDAARLARFLPDNPLATMVLGDSQAKAGQWKVAQSTYASLRADQTVTQILRPLLIAWSEAAQGDADAALALLGPLVESTRFRGLYALHAALIADRAGRTPLADRFYKIASADFGPLNLRTAVILASWRARNGDPEGAHRIIADLSAADGEFGLSRQKLDAAVAQPAVTSAADGIAEAYLAMAATLRPQNAELGEAMVRLSLAMRPDLTAARILLADIMTAQKRTDGALAVLADIPATDTLAPAVLLRRATLLDSAGQTDAAIAVLQKVADEHPDRPEAWAQLGDIYRGKQRFADAAAAYTRAIDKLGVPSRANWPLFYARGIALERAGQWDRAEADLKYALELSPDQPSILNYLAYSWTERNEHLAEAHGMLERAMAARPNEGAYIDSYGWVLLRQGDVEGAVRQLERAVELETEDPTINGHLGDALAAAGRRREAEFQWRRALNLKPDPEEAKHLEAQLAASPPAPAPAAGEKSQ